MPGLHRLAAPLGRSRPSLLTTCSSLSQLISRALHALPGRRTPELSATSGRHSYQNPVMSLHSPHTLLLWCPPARLCAQGTHLLPLKI